MSKTPKIALERAQKLRKLVDYHRKLYHEKDAPEISDEAYDSLINELLLLESKYPDLITPDSPTQRIGGNAIESFKKIKHEVPQWSFDNVFDENELKEWEEKIKRHLIRESDIENPNLEYCSEHKIDGLKVVLSYKEGVFVQGATRGDGVIGEDVTHNLKTFDDIPLKLTKKVDLIVSGEAWLPDHELKRINTERKKAGEPLFANARNAAAGTLRQLDPKIVRARRLRAFVYDIEKISKEIEFPETQGEELELLKSLGFMVNKDHRISKIDGVIDFYNEWLKKREKLEYGMDGVALKVNSRLLQQALGYTAKSPRFAVAFKFPAEQTTTVVEDIILQVGRTGVLTPVAKLRPVLVAGSTVSRATLHNEDEIKRLDIRIGDTVILEKAGDVIPDIVRVLTELRTGKEKKFTFPKRVPECGGDGSIERIPGQAAYRCVYLDSAVQQKRKLEHFVSKKAFAIDGLGKKIIEQLMDESLLSSFDDIFTLKREDLLNLEGFREKSADNLLDSIVKSKKVTLPRFLIALSIPQVGEETAEDIADEFGTIELISKATFDDLNSIPGVGPIVSESVVSWFQDAENMLLVKKLLSHVNIEAHKVSAGALKGRTFVLTGTLLGMSRDEAKEKIKERGGVVSGSVSAKTDFIVAGSDPGSKYEKGMDLGVKILSEEEFVKVLGN